MTNGVYFISHNATGGVIKVSTIEQAQNFYTMEKAENQINKVPGKCFGYYPVDTDATPVHEMDSDTHKVNQKILKKSAAKRKIYSGMQRKEIYDKAEGCCQLCGRKLTPHTMTLDHIIPFAKKSAAKRKIYSGMQRKEIYDKAEGCCQLCGRKLTPHTMTLDHIIPFADGGSNELDNLQAVCKQCNQLKANIYPEQFFDRITEIFMYQMEKKYSDNLTWKMARNMLMEIL